MIRHGNSFFRKLILHNYTKKGLCILVPTQSFDNIQIYYAKVVITKRPKTKKKKIVAKTNLPRFIFSFVRTLVINIKAIIRPIPINIPIRLLMIACCVKNAAITSIRMKAIVITNANLLFNIVHLVKS